jgi:uncharacterized protein (TIGR03086 family)
MDDNLTRSACASTEHFVEAVGPEQYDLPTPCSEWNVRQLLNHVVGTLSLGTALLSDRAPTVRMVPGEVPSEDLIGDDPIGAYRSGSAALLAVTTADAIGRTHATPLGDMPGVALAGFTALDVFVHGWDLARATGQKAHLDPIIAEQVLAIARQSIADEMGTRAPRIGPAVEVAANADATAQLVAFLGRQP